MSDKPKALRLADALAERRVTRWVHSTGEMPRADGYRVDVECFEAAIELRRLHDEVEWLRADAADFHMAYRMKCDEETKAQAVEVEKLREELARLKKPPSPLPLWGKGCSVCGIGSQSIPGVYGFVCVRGDCPTQFTCGVPK